MALVRNLNLPTWPLFTNTLESNWRKGVNPMERIDEHNMNIILNRLYAEIRVALDVSHPLRKPKKDRIPWWNSELEKQRKIVKRCRRSLGPGVISRNARIELEMYKELINKAKRDSWRRFTSDPETPKDMAQLLRIVNNVRAPDVGILRDDQGNFRLAGRVSGSTPSNTLWPEKN